MYTYKAEIISVYDGDTVTALIDLGFTVSVTVKLRLYGVNTPEIRTRDVAEKKAGYVARDFVRERILGKTVQVRTHKKGKYGRWVSTIWEVVNGTVLDQSLNDKLIEEGMAVEYLKD